MAYIETPDNVSGNAIVSGNAMVYGNASVYGDAMVSGNAMVCGNADIESNDDWFSFIYQGKTLTGYRSRNKLGYELNVNGHFIDLDSLSDGFDIVVNNLIKKFTKTESIKELTVAEIEAALGHKVKIVK